MSKHTPGPWTITRDEENYVHISGNWVNFARVVVRFRGDKQDYKTGLANARLIAAAPDMLAALKDARDALFDRAPITVGLEAQINAAIAKAEGG